VAFEVPADGMPLVGRKVIALEGRVLPFVCRTIPDAPIAAEVIALCAEHVFESVGEEEGVKLDRLDHVVAVGTSGLGSVPQEMGGVDDVVGPALRPEMVGENVVGPGHPAANVGFHAVAVERRAGDALLEPEITFGTGAARIARTGAATGPTAALFDVVPGFSGRRRGGDQAAGGEAGSGSGNVGGARGFGVRSGVIPNPRQHLMLAGGHLDGLGKSTSRSILLDRQIAIQIKSPAGERVRTLRRGADGSGRRGA